MCPHVHNKAGVLGGGAAGAAREGHTQGGGRGGAHGVRRCGQAKGVRGGGRAGGWGGGPTRGGARRMRWAPQTCVGRLVKVNRAEARTAGTTDSSVLIWATEGCGPRHRLRTLDMRVRV